MCVCCACLVATCAGKGEEYNAEIEFAGWLIFWRASAAAAKTKVLDGAERGEELLCA